MFVSGKVHPGKWTAWNIIPTWSLSNSPLKSYHCSRKYVKLRGWNGGLVQMIFLWKIDWFLGEPAVNFQECIEGFSRINTTFFLTEVCWGRKVLSPANVFSIENLGWLSPALGQHDTKNKLERSWRCLVDHLFVKLVDLFGVWRIAMTNDKSCNLELVSVTIWKKKKDKSVKLLLSKNLIIISVFLQKRHQKYEVHATSGV